MSDSCALSQWCMICAQRVIGYSLMIGDLSDSCALSQWYRWSKSDRLLSNDR
jgi:hypothetical protein